MITITSDEWIADLGALTCRNINTHVVVEFTKSGKTYIGKVKYMPIEQLLDWAKLLYGPQKLRDIIDEATEVFLRALAERDYEDKHPNQMSNEQ